jgi:hypothetical protein
MRIFEWKNKRITEADLFIKLDENELKNLAKLFPDITDACTEFDGYYVYVNTNKKTIIPLRMLYQAFSGLYNGNTPYGEELYDIVIDFNELTWQPYTELGE